MIFRRIRSLALIGAALCSPILHAETYVCSGVCWSGGSKQICQTRLDREGDFFWQDSLGHKYEILQDSENFLVLARSDRLFESQIGHAETWVINTMDKKFIQAFASMDLYDDGQSWSVTGSCLRLD